VSSLPAPVNTTSLRFALRIVTSDRTHRPIGEEVIERDEDGMRQWLTAHAAIADRYAHTHDERNAHWTFCGGLDPYTDVYISPANAIGGES
jgi:hypothetical protein